MCFRIQGNNDTCAARQHDSTHGLKQDMTMSWEGTYQEAKSHVQQKWKLWQIVGGLCYWEAYPEEAFMNRKHTLRQDLGERKFSKTPWEETNFPQMNAVSQNHGNMCWNLSHKYPCKWLATTRWKMSLKFMKRTASEMSKNMSENMRKNETHSQPYEAVQDRTRSGGSAVKW